MTTYFIYTYCFRFHSPSSNCFVICSHSDVTKCTEYAQATKTLKAVCKYQLSDKPVMRHSIKSQINRYDARMFITVIIICCNYTHNNEKYEYSPNVSTESANMQRVRHGVTIISIAIIVM